ncbi:MAG: LapA family protein [Pseudomonadota bacterium]
MKLLRWIVLPPVIVLVMAIAIANRGTVRFSLDPFDQSAPALSFDLPLFLIILASVFLGILVGGMGAWSQARRKKAVKAAEIRDTGANLPALRGEG